MKVTLIIWISAIILQEVEPGTLVRIPRDVASLKSSIHTEYEANYKQKGKHGNDSFSTIKGNQEILHDNCNDTWNEFAEKCAGLVKDLIASLANTISSSPGDATNLQLHIKNNFTHVDTSHKRNCFKRPPTCLSNLNFSSLFNNETGNILNQPNAVAPISIQTTLKKPDSCEQGSTTPIRPNDEDIILNNSPRDPQRIQQGFSLDDVNGPHINQEEAEVLTGSQINNNRRQVKYPTTELDESENTMDKPEDSTTDSSTSSKLPVIPIHIGSSSSNRETKVLFDPNDMSLEISAVPSNPPFFIRNTTPEPFSVDGMGNSENLLLDQSVSNDNVPLRGSEPLGVAGQSYASSESSNEFFSNSVDRKNSLSPKYSSQVSSEEEKYHTYLPPQSLVGEPLLGDSQQLHEEFENEEKPDRKVRGHANHEENDHFLEKMPHPTTHDHHPPLPKILNEESPLPVIPHHPPITPTTASPLLTNPALPPMLSSEDSESKEPGLSQLSTDYIPDLSKTNASPHSISHQDPQGEQKHHYSNPHPTESQPIITDESPPPILIPGSEPKETQPEILPTQISNVGPLAKEVSHHEYSNEKQPPSALESVPSPVSTEPQILNFPQSSNMPLEASNHLSESPASVGELVSSEESPNYGSPEKESSDDKSSPALLLIPAPELKEPISHFDKPSSSVEQLEIVPPHDSHNTHQHPHPHSHHLHPHHHPDSSLTPVESDNNKKSLPEIKNFPIVESEEIPSSPKRELARPHPSHSKIDLVPVSPSDQELHPPSSPKVELVPVPSPEKELPPPPPKMELVPVPPPKEKLPSRKTELVPHHPPEDELLPPPPKMELIPVSTPKEELPLPKMELVPHHPAKDEHPLPPPPPPKMELVPVPPPEKELPPPPPPPPKIELVPVALPEKELPPPLHPPSPPPKIEFVPVAPPEKELPPPPPPPPPPKVELVPVPPPEKELPPPPPPPKMELVPVPPPEKELPPPPPPPPPKVELVPVPPPEKELPPPPPPPPKIELVPVAPPEKDLPPPLHPPPPPPKIEFVPPAPPEKELPPPPPPPPPPKVELIPVPPPEKELPPPPPKIELVPVALPEKELPPPPPPSPKMELVPVPPPEKELPPPPHPPPPPPPKMELVPVPPPEKELPPPPPPPPPKVKLVPVPPPEKELPPPPPPPSPPKIKLVPVTSSEQNEIPVHDLKDDKPFADMPWPPHAPHPAHHHHPHHPPPHQPHHHHHHPPKKDEDDDDESLYSAELRALEEERQLEREKATTFQTTSADPTPPESSLSYPPFFMPNPTSQAPPPLTIPNSEAYPIVPSPPTFKTTPASKEEDDEDDDEENCCSCEACTEDEGSGVKSHRTSACQDLEQARRELKAIFDKIKKKLKCGRKTQRPTITS